MKLGVDHGKILHQAPNREQQYTEGRVFHGFKSRFRIEEREPEIAFIDQMELVVLLTDGKTIQLQRITQSSPRAMAITCASYGGIKSRLNSRYLTGSRRMTSQTLYSSRQP
jgi:hypothetical protein